MLVNQNVDSYDRQTSEYIVAYIDLLGVTSKIKDADAQNLSMNILHNLYTHTIGIMKEAIHPNYVETKVVCACGETFTTRSTKGDANGELRVDICSKCHPYFTGKQKFVDAGGRVDKFKKRLEQSGK